MLTVGDIVDLVQGTYSGDRSQEIHGVRPLADAGENDLSFLSNPKYAPMLEKSRAAVVLVSVKQEGTASNWIRVGDPYLALAKVLQKWFGDVPVPPGISEKAAIAASARLGSNVRVAAFASIGERTVIGDDVVILEGSVVGPDCEIGSGTLVYPNVAIYHGSRIGRNCILHAGVVIGADGYGFATAGGRHHKVPQIGVVRIGDDVEVGANTTIDRAALGETVIGEGTKIDNLVQIGHNVRIGRHCLIVSQTGISGSTEIGDYCVFAGQVGTYGHLRIGDQVQVAARGVVTKDWSGPTTLAGHPAVPLKENMRREVLLRRLPELVDRLKSLDRERSKEEGE